MIYMPAPTRIAYIKPDHETCLVNHLELAKESIFCIARKVKDAMGEQMRETQMAQFVSFALLQVTFGLPGMAVYNMLDSPYFARTRGWIESLDGHFPGGSTVRRINRHVFAHGLEDIEKIAQDIQDTLWNDIGTSARESLKSIMEAKHEVVVSSDDCFFGILKPS